MPNNESKAENRPPVFRDITIRNVCVLDGGRVTLEGLDETHRLGIQFDNVVFDDPSAITISATHADVKIGPRPFNLGVEGSDVKVSGTLRKAPTNACVGKFVGFPVR